MTPSRILRFPSDRSVGWLRARGLRIEHSLEQ